MGERMTINLDEITKALGEITQGGFVDPYLNDENAHLIAHAPEWLRLLVEQNKEILARNEELQRRVEKLEKALQFYARLDEDMSYDEIEEDHGRRAVEALAKEQDDD